MGLIPGLGRSPGEENGNPLQYSCLEVPWTEEPGGLQSMGSKRIGHDLVTKQQQSRNSVRFKSPLYFYGERYHLLFTQDL